MRPEATECAELIAARVLVPEIAARALEFERERRLASDCVQSMVDAGLVQMAIPAIYGGLESHLIDILRVIEEISYADGSAGWCLMNYQTTAFVSALLEPQRAKEIFAAPERAIPGGVLAPSGKGHYVDGDLIVNGRWAFASGCDNVNWLLGTVVITNADGEPQKNADGTPQILLPFFDRTQFKILDTWRVSGLRASGSHDVEIRDARVPAGRWLSLNDPTRAGGTLFRFPIISTFPPAVAAVALGIARAAYDCFVDIAARKVPVGVTTPLREQGAAQIDLAHAEALMDSARSYLYETVEALWTSVERGEPASEDARRRIRLAGTHAAASAATSVDLLYNAAGATSIADTCPLQRYFRDVHVVTQHMHVSGAGYERMGRLRLTGTTLGLL
jgi:alkylation response protein AidB-like acyl-CoA dehydrogenase